MCRNDYAVIRLDDYEGGFSIVNKDDIETKYLCETYDNHGNQIGCENAGCYSFNNPASGMHEDCIKEINEKFNLKLSNESWMSNINEWERYLKNNEVPENRIDEILEFIEKFEEKNSHHIKTKSIDYWDGRNWRTLILEILELVYDGYTDGYILDEEEAADILAAWEKIDCSVRNGPTFTTYNGVGYLFSDSGILGWQVADCEVIESGKNVSVQIEDDVVEVTPYWVDDMSFFFEYKGEIYFAEGYISPEREHLFDIHKTNVLES